MAFIEVTDATFASFKANSCCILTFTSPWCSACKKLYPFIEGLAHEFKDRVVFGSMDISVSPRVPAEFKIFSIPAALLLIDGEETRRFSGAFSIQDLRKALIETL
ncbi:MAG: thioredoxin family protein [Desulfomonilia bacterium]